MMSKMQNSTEKQNTANQSV